MAGKYDLSQTIIPFLDRHMVLPVLENLQEHKVFNERDLLVAKLHLVTKTSMVDYGVDQYKELYNTDKIPKDMEERRVTVLKKLETYTANCTDAFLKMLTASEDELSEAEKLRSDKNFNREYLLRERGITAENIEALFPFAKLTYDFGSYQMAADILFYYRMLTQDDEKKFEALWGKLAAEILMTNFDSALDDILELRDILDVRQAQDSPVEQMQQRTWLIHWGLVIMLSLEDLDTAIDFFFQDKTWNTIQTSCPHILRYVCVAVIIAGKNKKNLMRELVKILAQEKNNYSDPLTEFLLNVYIEFDFDAAYLSLEECGKVVENDFFTQHIEVDIFMKAARQILFDCCCRIHKCMDIDSMCERLQIKDDREIKIVEMIRNSNYEGKIDSEKNQVNMCGTKAAKKSNYSTVLDLERVKTLASRSSQLANQIEKKYAGRE